VVFLDRVPAERVMAASLRRRRTGANGADLLMDVDGRLRVHTYRAATRLSERCTVVMRAAASRLTLKIEPMHRRAGPSRKYVH
jgi:hypothetical protein